MSHKYIYICWRIVYLEAKHILVANYEVFKCVFCITEGLLCMAHWKYASTTQFKSCQNILLFLAINPCEQMININPSILPCSYYSYCEVWYSCLFFTKDFLQSLLNDPQEAISCWHCVPPPNLQRHICLTWWSLLPVSAGGLYHSKLII